MNILFDLNHPVDVNFFKNSILLLKEQGHKISVIYRDRGVLEKIIKFELPEISLKRFGFHHKNFLSKVFFQLLRDFSVFKFLKKNKFDMVCCFGSTSAISSWLSNTPYLAFDDDFEYKLPFFHANIFCTHHIYPDFINFNNNKTIKYSGFKELAYLHPNYLKISNNILKHYNLKADNYVFIREIDNISLNYNKSVSILSKLINKLTSLNYKVVLSIENKNLILNYPKNCIILEEPVGDIYSLLYNSSFAISSGDTVARECALLGVPLIYTGGRTMAVNKLLVKNSFIIESQSFEFISQYIDEFKIENKINLRKKINAYIANNCSDTTSIILENIQSI